VSVIDLLTHSSIKTKRRDLSSRLCRCQQVTVNEQTRMLSCQQCERVIDPFDWLYKQGQQQERAAFDVQQKRSESERLNKEIEELKRVKRNLQAQIKRIDK
jgi:hypothetical protein